MTLEASWLKRSKIHITASTHANVVANCNVSTKRFEKRLQNWNSKETIKETYNL